ncbi:hypothetical protein FQR65_LT01183 [Abscondita terminalis]|nr:hypothetical protein FQR65_LT01183 [Abscondita terminalis]
MDCYESRWRMPSYLFLLLLVCAGLIFYVDIFQLQSFQISTSYRLLEKSEKDDVQGFLIKTEGCRIPYIDPFDSAVTKFITKVKPIVCNKNKPPLMDSNLTGIYLLNTSLAAYKIKNIAGLKCCYTIFKRVDSKPNQGDNQVSFGKCIQFNNSVLIDAEFVQVTCSYSNKTIYKDFFSFVPMKPKFLNLTTISQKLNVLIVGIDSVSRINFHRQMPLTAQLMREFGAIEFLGYNKVADNTFPNLIPLLTGLYESELVKNCWHKQTDKFDKCHFIWNNYSSNGFATVFAEDGAWMGLFNYKKRGFRKQPTDYFWGTFDRVAENQIGNAHDLNYQCIGSREIYRVLLDYTIKYVSTMDQNKVPYFGIFWGCSLSHDYLNKPQLGDKYYVKFFRKLFEMGALNNTILIFMSDHGIRFGDIRFTYQGRMEERLPFLYVIFPKTYHEEYRTIYLNLKKNSRRLTTPFDLHETLKDLLNPFKFSQTEINRRISARKGNERAYSLFEPIPENRTCANAQISSHWCTCQVSTVINKNETVIIEIANYSVQHLNELLGGYAECAKLSLAEIYNARVHSSEKKMQANSYTLDYTIGFRTEPGGGNFEATIRKKNSTFSVVGSINIFHLQSFQISTSYRLLEKLEKDDVKDFQIKTEGCRIPYMDPFDSAVIKFITKVKPIVCNNNKPPLMESNLTGIYLLNTSLAAYNINNITDLKCCYMIFKRVDSNPNQTDNQVSFGKCIQFNNSVLIDTEFVQVTCTHRNETIYMDFFSFVPLKPKFINLTSSTQKLNVLVVGIDSVSRINFHRQMPLTAQLMKEFGAIEFLGYNKVADNTFPNLIPLLTGLHLSELVKNCWHKQTDKFDKCHFIWNNYSSNGFATVFAEDGAWMGLFNYRRRGFCKQPTDYLWGTFDHVAEDQIGNAHDLNYQCIGSREIYRVLLDYTIKYVSTMDQNKVPYFGIFWGCSLSHDYLNKPQLGDKHYVNFFRKLFEMSTLSSTILIFMSDHGIRYGDIRSTYQGRMEERLPFLYVIFPKTYQEEYRTIYLNLKKNSRRLTTPFDLHETLKDLVNPFKLSQTEINRRISARKGNERAYSLFEPIPDNRTCANAHISSHWCTCQVSTVINKNETVIIEIANYSVQHLNRLLGGYAECAKLSLAEIYNARVHSSEKKIQANSYTLDYTIGFRTEPGGGNFEATIRKKNSTFSVLGSISRINLYGDQSRCINDFQLKLYCYCV